jgi:hypothetical protein
MKLPLSTLAVSYSEGRRCSMLPDALLRPPVPTPQLLLTSRQAAAALSISERTLAQLKSNGQLKPIKLAGRGKARSLRYAVADLQTWIEKQKENANAKSDPPE